MTEEQKQKAKDAIVPYIGAVVLCLGLVGIYAFKSDNIEPTVILSIIAAVGGLMFWRSSSKGGGSGTTAAAVLIASSLLIGGCGAACQTERTVVNALGAGIVAADSVVGDRGGEEYDRASMIALGAHELGEAAVDACELVRDGAGWQAWVALALEAARGVAAMIDGAGPADVAEPVPPELVHAISLLEAEAR